MREVNISIEKTVGFYEEQINESFECVFGISVESCDVDLSGVSLRAVNLALGVSREALDEESQSAWDRSMRLFKVAGSSITKNRLLVTCSFGLVLIRATRGHMDEGNIPAAIESLGAAGMAAGVASASASEWLARSSPGRKGADKRKEAYSRKAEEALEIYRREISPVLTANAAAERLRSRGVGISYDKLARLIAAEKKRSKESK